MSFESTDVNEWNDRFERNFGPLCTWDPDEYYLELTNRQGKIHVALTNMKANESLDVDLTKLSKGHRDKILEFIRSRYSGDSHQMSWGNPLLRLFSDGRWEIRFTAYGPYHMDNMRNTGFITRVMLEQVLCSIPLELIVLGQKSLSKYL